MRLLRLGSACLAVLLSLLVGAASARAAPHVVVSLTFDDGDADAFQAGELMRTFGVRGTFYIDSATVGLPTRVTWSQVRALARQGHEIASHTRDHAALTTLAPEQVAWQACDDRVALAARGFRVRSFAYPYALHSLKGTDPIVGACGFSSERGIGGIRSPGYCPKCAPAESVPPAYPRYTLSPQAVLSRTGLDTIEGYVTQAEQTARGGWVQIVFHHVCEGDCPDPFSVTPDTLNQFLTWLSTRANRGTVVQTVGQVAGGAPHPAVPGYKLPVVERLACRGTACPSGWGADVGVAP